MKLSKWVENTVGKGEIAHYEQFLLCPQCFPGASKGIIVWEWVNSLPKNSLPNNRILNWTKLKAFADDKIILNWPKLKAFAEDKINVVQKLKFVVGKAENIVGKGENASNQQFF